MQEVKYNYQNITAKVSENRVTIINKNLFLNTNAFDCVVLVERNGKALRQIKMETEVEPLGEKTYPLPFAKETLPGEFLSG